MREKVLGLVVVVLTFAFVGWYADAKAAEQENDMQSFKKQAEERLKTLDKKLDELKAKAPEVKTEVKKEFKKAMTDLRMKQKLAKQKWTAVKKASEKRWEKAKSELSAAIQDLEDSYEKTVSKFQEKKE